MVELNLSYIENTESSSIYNNKNIYLQFLASYGF